MPADGTIVELVGDELRRLSDTGELATREGLREAVGVGAGDVEAALDALRDRGFASEVEPNAFRWVADDVEAEIVDETEPEPVEERTLPPEGTQARARMAAPRQEVREKRVTLTIAVAKAIGDVGLGNLVLAGITEAEDAGVPFVFEVLP